MPKNILEKSQAAIEKSGDILNRIIAFLVGIFLSAIFFLFMLKLLNGMGIFLALAINFSIYFILKKHYAKHKLLKNFNKGLFTFTIVTAILFLIVYFAFFSLFQNLVS